MNVNILLYDDFETLDAFGPAQVFGSLPDHFYIKYVSVNGGIMNSTHGLKVWTEKLEISECKDILVVPGGRGAKKLLFLEDATLNLIRDCIRRVDYCLMVENGSALIAQTGSLFHRRVAEFAFDENWKRMFTGGISWVPDIHWLADGKFYSSSTTVAGLEMTLGLVADMIDPDEAMKAAQKIGYPWDPECEEGVFL